jgi:uncharacterized phage infection (PIP) family protein YhgE
MKAKKAAKRLAKVETMLSNVIKQYADNQPGVRDLLDTAKESVTRAKKSVSLRVAKAAKKPAAKADQPRRRRLTAAARKRLSVAAKRRWASAKRKGVQSVTARPLIKTATA